MSRLALALPIALIAALSPGCVGARRGNVCPEYRNLACLTQAQCAPDEARGCLVCACTPWDSPPAREGGAATARPEGDGRPPPSPAR